MVRAAVLGELRERGRWLLVFDNAEKPADVAGWLPGGGHVLITSRERKWAEIAAPVEVDVLARPESVAILQGRVTGSVRPMRTGSPASWVTCRWPSRRRPGHRRVQAETGMAAAEYLGLLRTQAGRLLAEGAPGSYPRSLAAATRLIADRLDRDDPAAAQLASVCAFLGPEPIPEDLFTGAPGGLPGDLAARAADPLAWRQTLAQLTRQSLARVDQRGLVMHRLTQAILRDRLPRAGRRHPRTRRGDRGRQRPRRTGQSGHLAEMGRADAAPAGRDRPGPPPATAGSALDGPATRCYYLVARGDTRTGLTWPAICASTGATGSATTTTTR